MNKDEIKQILIDNGFENYISLFEENHLLDSNVLSSMTNDDYVSIGVSILGDRKKLLFLFSKDPVIEEDSSLIDADHKEEKNEFINIEINGKEFCYKDGNSQILFCRKCHNRVSEDATLCNNCNNNLVHSEEEIVLFREENNNESKNFHSPNDDYIPKTKSRSKPITALIILGIFGIVAFFGYKLFSKTNYNTKLENVCYLLTKSSSEVEDCVNLIHSVWYNKIFDEYNYKTKKYTEGTRDFNGALNKLFEDSSFTNKIKNINKDSQEISTLMKQMMNPPSEYREAYLKLNSCYEDYVKFVGMATSPTGNLQSYTQNFNSLDSSIASKLKSLELYVK